MNLVSLQFKTTSNYQDNLDKLVSLIDKCEDGSFILAPELCLSGFDYDKLDEAFGISITAIDILKKLSLNKTISLTLTIKKNDKYFNTLHIFSNGNIVYTQSKFKLFTLDDEYKHFTSGNINDIKIIDIDGIKVASLICFELRFIDLWKKVKGTDIILVPAMWGKKRKQNFEVLTNSLAVMHQCYVIASDSCNDDMASSSGIISPFGKEIRDDSKEIISVVYEKKEIKKMRRYLEVGINQELLQ